MPKSWVCSSKRNRHGDPRQRDKTDKKSDKSLGTGARGLTKNRNDQEKTKPTPEQKKKRPMQNE